MKHSRIHISPANLLVVASCLAGILLVTILAMYLRPPFYTCEGRFDVVLLGGEIMDGLGNATFKADIGIRNGHIACVGRIDGSMANQAIDANGLTVSPGFIDVHTHVERNVPTAAPFLSGNFVRQGVTTVITGNCGRSSVDISEFFKTLETYGADVNVATLVGHNTIRLQVLKQSPAAPNAEQLSKMEALVSKGMDDGAFGLSTGLVYFPGTFAKTAEITHLTQGITKAGGLYVSHIRDEGPKGEEAIREAIDIGERTGVHVHISHFKAQGPNQWGSSQARLDLIKVAHERGLAVSVDQYPYIASSTGLAVLLPSWLSEGGLNIARQKLTNPATRKRIRSEMLAQLRESGWNDYSFARVAYYQRDPSLVGMSITEITNKRGDTTGVHRPTNVAIAKFETARHGIRVNDYSEVENQADTIMDLFSHGGAQMIFFDMNDDDVETIMKNSDVMFGSDSSVRGETGSVLPHPRGSGTFPRVIGLYARQRKLFSMEEAVRRMTSLPAATFGLKHRGQITQGYWADLVIFDRNRILDTATYQKPLTPPEGIYYVIVNGSVVLDRGVTTRSLPGMVVRHSSQKL